MSVQEKNKDICHDECCLYTKKWADKRSDKNSWKKRQWVTNQHINQYNENDEF